MRIAVIGAGGVGGYFGARLAAAGHEVWFAARGAHREAMAHQGLTLRSALGDVALEPVRLLGRGEPAGPCEVVLVCVKMTDLADTIPLLRPLLGAESAVIPLQNGIEAEAILAEALGAGHVLGGTARISAEIAEPGVIRHVGTMARLVFGELDNRRSARALAFEAACKEAGIEAEIAEDTRLDVWRKFVMLAPFAGATAFYRSPMGGLRDGEGAALLDQLVAETAAVGRAEGVQLPDGLEAEVRTQQARLPDEMKSSMLVDLERGKPLELRWLTGAVIALGQRHGIETPASRRVLDALLPYAEGAE